MKIGVISDSHDQHELILDCVQKLNDANVDLVVHCGDWVSPFILHSFKGLKMPMKGVFGNNDGDKFRHLQTQEKHGLNIAFEDRFLDFTMDKKRIAAFHGDYPEIVDALVKCGTYDVVLHGHTHRQVNQKHGRTLSLNPGSLMRITMNMPLGASFAIYDTNTHQAEHISL